LNPLAAIFGTQLAYRATQTIEGGDTVSTRPMGFGDWYRFDPVNVDTGNVNIEMTRWDAVNGVRETVGYGSVDFVNTNGLFVNFEFDFTYETSNLPDTVLILMTSGGDVGPQEGTALFLDDLYYTYPAGIETPESIGLSIFPNPTSDVLNFRSDKGFQFSGGSIMSVDGKVVKNFSLSSNFSQLNVAELPAGSYILELLSGKDAVVRQSFLKN
jgi:hypothetical protein